jgi:hypothetical protein
LFDKVQARLDENLRSRRLRNERSQALLLGKLYDDRGNRMTPSYAIKKGVRYRYYVSCVLAQGRKDEAGSVSRIAASEIETIVLGALAKISEANAGAMAPDCLRPVPIDEKSHPEIDDANGQQPDPAPDRERVERRVDRMCFSVEVGL